MKFRPCIDIHNGCVKQIVGSSLSDSGIGLRENFVSSQSSSFYANLFRKFNLCGGHIIKLDKSEETNKEAISALQTWPGCMQIGGGINDSNYNEYLDQGASHVIVTSFVFNNGIIDYDNLRAISKACGKSHLVLDLSCKLVDGDYHIATERWQNISKEYITPALLYDLSFYCDEYLIHDVSVEGMKKSIDTDLISILTASPIKVTYAGGISCYEDIEKLAKFGEGKIDFTIGSSLDIFGGNLSFEKIATKYH